MAHRAPQDDRWPGLRLVIHARRTRMIAAVIATVLGVGTPVVVWGTSGFTVDGQPTRPPDDPAGLGITGALPGDPLPGGPSPGDLVPGDLVPGDLVPGDLVPEDLALDDEVPGFPPGPDLLQGPLGIPAVVLGAYRSAEQALAVSHPGCQLSWSVLAGIGRIESGHARGGRVDTAGDTLGPILGPPLDGSPGVAAIADTDRGVLDQDLVWDRAVGPMQFIPTSWRSYGVDANRDGVANPHNIHDAATAAGRYLCAAGGDLTNPAQLQAAVFRYNHSSAYVTIVLRWAQAYRSGVVPTAPAPGPVPPGPNGNGSAPILAGGAPQPPAVEPPAVEPPAVEPPAVEPPAITQPELPSVLPSPLPSAPPSPDPSVSPAPVPSASPSPDPSPVPSVSPSPVPSVSPSPVPSVSPTPPVTTTAPGTTTATTTTTTPPAEPASSPSPSPQPLGP